MKNTIASLLRWLRRIIPGIWRTARPWLFPIVLIVAAKYTGALGAIQYVTGSILLKTGFMDASTGSPAVVHDFAYDFNLRDLNGKIISGDQLRGKTLFINVWATWCGPCRIEMPSIEALYRRADTSKVAFFIISVDEPGHLSKVKAFVADKGFTFPVYTPTGSLPSVLEVRSIPTSFVIDPEGRVVMRESGLANYNTEEFQKFIESL